MVNEYVVLDDNYLAHHGILGMKWGIRRYQNKDGSLTEKGRKRYHVGRAMEDPEKYYKSGKAFDDQTRMYRDIRKAVRKERLFATKGKMMKEYKKIYGKDDYKTQYNLGKSAYDFKKKYRMGVGIGNNRSYGMLFNKANGQTAIDYAILAEVGPGPAKKHYKYTKKIIKSSLENIKDEKI